jgi:hypothetical protein
VSQALAKVVAKVTVAPSRSNQARRVLEVGVQANMFSKMVSAYRVFVAGWRKRKEGKKVTRFCLIWNN